MNEITTTEQARLAEIEATIQDARIAINERFRVIGQSLSEIRDSKLYRQAYATFEDYVEARLSISRQRAYQLMDGNAVAENVNRLVDIPTEAAARELVKFSKPIQVKVAKVLAKANKSVTAAAVKRAVATVTGQPPKGGIHAMVIAGRAEQEPIAAVTLEARDEARRVIAEWWAVNRGSLMSFPQANPEVVVNRILKLFEA